MTPNFAAAVDPVFLSVLDLLDRLESGVKVVAEVERERIKQAIDRAELKLGHSQEWQLAKYALVAWIDDALILNDWNTANGG